MQLSRLKKIFMYGLGLFFCLNSLKVYSYHSIIVTSTIKCGTHLLTQAVSLLTGKKKVVFDTYEYYIQNNKIPAIKSDEYLQNHIAYTQETSELFRKNNFKVLYIYRDPRDQLVSRAYWILAKPEAHPEYQGYTTVSTLITRLIPEIELVYKPFMGWMYDNTVCTVRFEDLIGPKGRGDVKVQVGAVKRIAHYLGIPLTQSLLTYCLTNLFGGKRETFRQGQIGSWRYHFTKEHKQLFKKHGGKLLKELSYEKNNNW